MRVSRVGLPDVDFQGAEQITSREAVAMYKVGSKYYKLLNYKEDIHKQKDALRDEVHSPVVRLNRGTYHYTHNGINRTSDVLVIEMKEVADGQFFQLSNGGASRLEGWINTETDSERLKRISRALQAAKQARLTDPQGFYMTTGPDPIIFIDLHRGNVESGDLDKAIARADERRLQFSR